MDDESIDDAEQSIEDIADVDIVELDKHDNCIIVVRPEDRLTSHVLNRNEMTELISIRTRQIMKYNNCFSKDAQELSDAREMAELEMRQRLCPLILRRKIGEIRCPRTKKLTEYYEFWDPKQMTLPPPDR